MKIITSYSLRPKHLIQNNQQKNISFTANPSNDLRLKMDGIIKAVTSIESQVPWGGGRHDSLGENVAPEIVRAFDNAGDVTCAELANYVNNNRYSIIGQGFESIKL